MTTLTITPGGDIRFIWTDQLQPLLDLGKPDVRRVSQVEPTEDGQWTTDLSRVDGPVLGPYPLRQEALSAEVDWLHDHGF